MWADIWHVLGMVTAGSPVWLGIIFLLTILGEMGLPLTCPILESLLMFTGFQIAHGSYIIDSIPFLAVVFAGRLCGSSATYWLSSSLGDKIIDKFGRRIRITRERLDQMEQKLGTFALPTIITARFIPGFTVVSSIACGVSGIRYRNFLIAVAIHTLAWEAIFLALGVLGGRTSEAFDPQLYPVLLVIWIATMIAIGAGLGYFAFRRARNRD